MGYGEVTPGQHSGRHLWHAKRDFDMLDHDLLMIAHGGKRSFRPKWSIEPFEGMPSFTHDVILLPTEKQQAEYSAASDAFRIFRNWALAAWHTRYAHWIEDKESFHPCHYDFREDLKREFVEEWEWLKKMPFKMKHHAIYYVWKQFDDYAKGVGDFPTFIPDDVKLPFRVDKGAQVFANCVRIEKKRFVFDVGGRTKMKNTTLPTGKITSIWIKPSKREWVATLTIKGMPVI